MGRYLIYIGVFIVIAGLVVLYLEKNGWTGLPGDITIKKENFTFHFPIVTSILISLILSLVVYLWNKLS